jgi:hypothetical protein
MLVTGIECNVVLILIFMNSEGFAVVYSLLPGYFFIRVFCLKFRKTLLYPEFSAGNARE